MKIGVIGAGTMGAGIAEVMSKHYDVVVRDISSICSCCNFCYRN